jgi:deazaflavin-dependent oxidoreductase (nitroreductase family)
MRSLSQLRRTVTDPDLLADPDVSRRLRLAFRRFNRAMVTMWRLGLGRWFELWPAVSGRVLVLVHTGRRSGRRYRTPLNYAAVGDDVYCLAGFGSPSDWYRNITADPSVEIWMPDGWWRATAEDVSDSADRLVLLRAVLKGSGVVASAFGVPPTLSDDRLAAVTRDYRLVRLRRTVACTGPGGPGDLAWVWPAAALVLLPPLLRRLRRRVAQSSASTRNQRSTFQVSPALVGLAV